MNLECLNNIITDELAINIDISNIKSWDLNENYVVSSLTKWDLAKSDNIILYDYGLTAFDNGRTNTMWKSSSLTNNDNYLKLYRVGYNDIHNPNNDEYSGVTATTQYTNYEITSISGDSGNYFNLNGGYLQGYFKLHNYEYELLPSRYGNGITFEFLLHINDDSNGIFYYMGSRSEDKYNPAFSGETVLINDLYSGITTSFENNLNAVNQVNTLKKAFKSFDDMTDIEYIEPYSIDNLKNNVISFELTTDKRLAYKYIDELGFINTNVSQSIISSTGFTLITITYTPDNLIEDNSILECSKRRNGTLNFYVNGRLKWVINKFPEFYFKNIDNNPEKQIGVPYNISFGGGSFGLKHSWHYDYQKYKIYNKDLDVYVNDNFNVVESQNHDDVLIDGLLLSTNNTTFVEYDDENNQIPLTVMEINYTGTSNSSYLIKFNNPIYVLSNRDYDIKLSLYDTGLFDRLYNNEISLVVYSEESDINIIDEISYNYPKNHNNTWYDIMTKFRTDDNLGKVKIHIGILIKSTGVLNINETIYINDFSYTGADILVKDSNKSNLIIEDNFNNSFIGGIQKMRIYTKSLNSQEVLHNALIENKNNQNIIVSKGGRIIRNI